MRSLTKSQQTKRVAFLGVAFLILFTTFNSLQNIVSKLYTEYGYDGLGETSVLLIYLVFGAGTFFSPFVIRKYGFKKTMFLSALGYASYQTMGLILALWKDMPKVLGWALVLIGAAICGASASMIWVAQGVYVNEVAGQERKTELFGLFWGLFFTSEITGNCLTTFVLGFVGNTVYFIVLTILGGTLALIVVLSAFLFTLLPNEAISLQEKNQIALGREVQKMKSMIKDPKNRSLILYYFFPGLTVGFYATFLYKLIGENLHQEPQEDDDQYQKRVDFYSGLVFITLGAGQACTGIIMNKIAEPYCKFKLAVTATFIVEAAGFLSLLSYFLKSYGMCFAVALLWGVSQSFLQTNLGALIGQIFPGKVQAYSVYRIIFALGVTLTIILNIALKGQPLWIFLTLVMAVQIMVSRVSIELGKHKMQKGDEAVEYLLKQQSEEAIQ